VATNERILVCVAPARSRRGVVRTARRDGRRRQADWIAISVESPGLNEQATAQIPPQSQARRAARGRDDNLGGERFADEVLDVRGAAQHYEDCDWQA